MPFRPQIDDHGHVAQYKDSDTGQSISAKEYERLIMTQSASPVPGGPGMGNNYGPYTNPVYMPAAPGAAGAGTQGGYPQANTMAPPPPAYPVGGAYPQAMPGGAPGAYSGGYPSAYPGSYPAQTAMPAAPAAPAAPQSMSSLSNSSLIQPGAQMLDGNSPQAAQPTQIADASSDSQNSAQSPSNVAATSLRFDTVPGHASNSSKGYKTHGFLDATSIAILLPTLVLLALIIAAAHKKRLFPWQTIRTFNPPSGLMTPRDYERSYICPPNLRRHGRLGKRNPAATWSDLDGIVLPFGFLARTHLPITIPLGRLPNKNIFMVAPSGSGKTTLMRAVIKALLAKPCVVIALEAKANDPTLDEKREGFKYTLLPEAATAGFETLYFNPLDAESVHWNPLDLDAITFASSIVQDVNSLPPEEQHWAERDHGYIAGLTQLLKWGAVMVAGEDENGQAVDVQPLPCNPRGLMRLVNNRRNIVESLRRCKTNPNVPAPELSELTQTLSSIIRTDTDWDKNIQGVRGRLRMFKNPGVLRCTESSNIDLRDAMYRPTVLIFGAPASMGPDAESLASCFVYQLQNAMHYRYGTASVLPLFAFFDEYQTLNMDIAGRLSAIVRGANGGLAIILQNISQIAQLEGATSQSGVSPELKTIFSNSAIRVCLHNADESTAKFFAEEIGKHAIIVPGISDHYDSNGFGIFPTSWNRIHSQQVVARVDPDSIKRMEKHHALVFLSPAGDPEFGELKPFMCDLRGIEEIARLHLLHNVAGRQRPALPGEQQVPGEPGAPGVPGGPTEVPVAARVGNQMLAQLLSPQGGPSSGQPAGMPMPAAAGQGIAAMGGPPAGAFPHAPMPAAHQPNIPTQVAAAVAGAAAAGVAGAVMAGMAGRPPFPGSAAHAGQPLQATQPGQAMPPGVAAVNPAIAAGARPAAPAPAPVQAQAQPVAQPVAQPNAASDRVCPKCGKYPGKARFCIECGNFMGAPSAAQPAGGPPVPATYPTAQAPQTAQPAPQQALARAAAPQQQRQPLTTLHGDMTKYGVPQPGAQPGAQPAAKPTGDQPGQQPMPRTQPRGGGIEF